MKNPIVLQRQFGFGDSLALRSLLSAFKSGKIFCLEKNRLSFCPNSFTLPHIVISEIFLRGLPIRSGRDQMNMSQDDGLATKKELEAVKDELLAKLATKEELKQEVARLATKEELKREVAKLASKKDLQKLKKTVDQHTVDIAELKTDMKIVKWDLSQFRAEMKTFQQQTEGKFDRVFQAFDGISGQLLDIKAEMAAMNYTFRQHEERLDDHEKRITNLEENRA